MGNQQQFAEAHRRGFGAGRREAEAGHAPQVAQARASGEAKGQADVRFLRQLNLLGVAAPPNPKSNGFVFAPFASQGIGEFLEPDLTPPHRKLQPALFSNQLAELFFLWS